MSQMEISLKLGVSLKRVQTAMRFYAIKPRRQVKRNQWGAGNSNWKGNKAGYQALHLRVYRVKGCPRFCEKCKTTKAKRYEWASMSKRYDDPSDYKRLCLSCHKKHDNVIKNLRNAGY